MEYCKGKAEKDLKTTSNQRTFRPQVSGRAVMSLIHQSLGCDIDNVSLGNMTLTVVIGRPHSLDHVLRDSVSEMDFRAAGFGGTLALSGSTGLSLSSGRCVFRRKGMDLWKESCR